MKPIRVLIVDDSVVFRSRIRAALEGKPGIEVVGVAAHGRIALEKLAQNEVDLITLDLEMPEMDGLAMLGELKKRKHPAKVIVFSSRTQKGAETTLEALHQGASDFVAKPGGAATDEFGQGSATEIIQKLLLAKVLQFGGVAAGLGAASSQGTQVTGGGAPTVPDRAPSSSVAPLAGGPAWANLEKLRPRIVVLGSSTGGPNLLESIFERFSGPLDCPIVIAQHMPAVFTTSFAERLARTSGLRVTEARQMETLQRDQVYVAPGDYHLRLLSVDGQVKLALDQGPQRHSVRPSVDCLFESAAGIYGNGCVGVVLTGMGADGREGALEIKRRGGSVLIQDRASSVVYGMPLAVEEAGAYDRIANPGEIRRLLEKFTAVRPLAGAA